MSYIPWSFLGPMINAASFSNWSFLPQSKLSDRISEQHEKYNMLSVIK
jgi:hypothetical protein